MRTSHQNDLDATFKDDAPDLLTLKETAVILRCSKSHVSHLVNGKIPNLPVLPKVQIGRRVLIRRQALQEWLASAETSPVVQ